MRALKLPGLTRAQQRADRRALRATVVRLARVFLRHLALARKGAR